MEEVEVIFVGKDLDATHQFAKELLTLFPNDVLTGFTISVFTGTRHIMMLAIFEAVTQEYETVIQRLITQYHIGVINQCEHSPEKWNEWNAELYKGDLVFTGYFNIDAAFMGIRERWKL